MKKTLIFTLMMVAALFFTSCVEDVNVEGSWTLVALDDGSQDYEREDGTLSEVVTLSVIKQGETEYGVAGFSGVNHFNGSASLNENNLTLGPLALTMMIGNESAQRIEDAFLRAFQEGGILSVEQDDGETVLKIENKKNDTELIFVQTILENTAWNLSMYNIGNAVTNVPADVAGVTIAFSEDERVYGSTGANNITGMYSFTKTGNLSFSSVGTTRMAASSPEVAEFERRLLELLGQVATFEISGQDLIMRSAGGEVLLMYSR